MDLQRHLIESNTSLMLGGFSTQLGHAVHSKVFDRATVYLIRGRVMRFGLRARCKVVMLVLLEGLKKGMIDAGRWIFLCIP